MLKRLLTGLGALAVIATVSAKPITPAEALARLGGSDAKKAASVKGKQGPRLVHTTKTRTGAPAVYLFNKGDDAGYLVLSADDTAYPLLGYADNGEAIEGNLPPQLEWWLSEYARQIEYAATHGVSGKAAMKLTTRADRQAIAPMIKSRWDQGEPYSNACPLVGTKRSYTGCVATAMAQVMNYWKYPEVGKGSISYSSEEISKRLSLNFANKKFDWDNMLDTYKPGQYTEEQADAVAYLMKACGYSVKMSYNITSSGALAMNIANGLKKYFNYDPNILYSLRRYHSPSEWDEMIYDNLKNVGPILYGGASMIGGGHSFVLDGYDGNGMYHFNWGWTGMSDGYFSLDALNPGSLGAGGGGGGGYNFTQDAVFGIQPPTGKPEEVRPLQMTQMGSLAGFIKDNVLYFDLFAEGGAMWVNYNPKKMKIAFGAIFEPQAIAGQQNVYTTVTDKNFSVAPGYGTDPATLKPCADLTKLQLADGTYKVYFATQELEKEDAEWLKVKENYGQHNYLILKKSGDKYTLEIEDVGRLEVVSGKILDNIYYGCAIQVEATVRNDHDVEMSTGLAPALMGEVTDNNGNKVMAPLFLGESILLTVPPHSSVTRKWTTSLAAMNGAPQVDSEDIAMKLTFFDEVGYNFYDEDLLVDVVLKPNPGRPNITMPTAPVIKNAQTVQETINGQKTYVYQVMDPNDIQVRTVLILNSGVMAYDTYACILQPSGEQAGMMEILTYQGHPVFMNETTRRQYFETKLSFPQAEPGNLYYLTLAYAYGQNLVALSSINPTMFRIASSGVNGIEDNEESLSYSGTTVTAGGKIELYSLQGTKVAEADSALSTAGLQPGVYIAYANGKALKIMVR